MARIELQGLTKTYHDGTVAVRSLDLAIGDGELVVLVGPSGCGKTTTLRMIAGLERPTGGRIEIDGDDVTTVAPGDRDVAMVFQNYALYPHMSVARNIAFGLRARGVPRAEQEEKVLDVARILDLEELLAKKPRVLSGGQRQRVAMGRAIARSPRAFLMDEPLSNLDARLRVQLRGEIVRLQRNMEATMVYVTHDQVEAMTMGDRVAVLCDGELQQFASPASLYDSPSNVFVARFLGSPPMNTIPGRIERAQGGGLNCVIANESFELSDAHLDRHPGLAERVGHGVVVGIRPEVVGLRGARVSGVCVSGVVRVAEMLGSDMLAHVAIGPEQRSETAAPIGETIVSARLDPEHRLRADDRVELDLDVTKLTWFDSDSGASLAMTAP